MIVSFGDRATEDLFHGRGGGPARRLPSNIVTAAIRKLDVLNAAHSLQDMRSPPGNRLEALRGDRRSFYSVRINDQWRLVFQWEDGNALNVQIVDYHRG